MKNYIIHDPWKIIEEGFNPDLNRVSESLFSIGNGHMGQRANFEEDYSCKSLQGSYIAGVYYPDKTRVGWWKNGYPEYFAKVLNAPSWIGLRIEIDNKILDISKAKIEFFRRELDMKKGLLSRTFIVDLDGKKLEVEATRFVSMKRKEIGAINYKLKLIEGCSNIKVSSFLDGNIKNEDSNYDELFWEQILSFANKNNTGLITRTKKTEFSVVTLASTRLLATRAGEKEKEIFCNKEESKTGFALQQFDIELKKNECIRILKTAVCLTDRDYKTEEIKSLAVEKLNEAVSVGYEKLKFEHEAEWEKLWQHSDIKINGDIAAQQGIRFNIFQLNQTYTGHDDRLNIGPKGFTGERYGGASYWDTEAYCLPFYMNTSGKKIARQLLLYRYKQLNKAIENAEKLGFSKGAALYPMVTMNGEECHNEWEITFEEIHRNGAIAYAIYDYVNTTGDETYLKPYGLDVLTAIARFWMQRINWSNAKNKYVMLGVTGPNEYENNVNNNWYTNYLAAWCLRYTADVADRLGVATNETKAFKETAEKIYLPRDEAIGIFLQQDGFLDKELIPADKLKKEERPLNQNWSWDRILRSCYIKQADVLQGLYFFEEEFDKQTIKANYDFYTPLTVHESSLSPCIHSILASYLGYDEQAYNFYLRTARLDLDDYNNDTADGCHTTSMAGTWMSIVFGFGGLRYKDSILYINPKLPKKWDSYAFNIKYKESMLRVSVEKVSTTIDNYGDKELVIRYGEKTDYKEILVKGKQSILIS